MDHACIFDCHACISMHFLQHRAYTYPTIHTHIILLCLESESGNFSDVLHDSASVTMAGKGETASKLALSLWFRDSTGFSFGKPALGFCGAVIVGKLRVARKDKGLGLPFPPSYLLTITSVMTVLCKEFSFGLEKYVYMDLYTCIFVDMYIHIREHIQYATDVT